MSKPLRQQGERLSTTQRELLEALAVSPYGEGHMGGGWLRSAEALERRGLVEGVGSGRRWYKITAAGRGAIT